jgi:hypothetical protein
MAKRRKKKTHRFGPPVLLRPGDAVRLWEEARGTQADGKGDRIGKGRAEYGRVVHVWDDNGWQDCWVAFFGFRGIPKPDKVSRSKPYILRYHYTSLELLERPGEDHTVLVAMERIKNKVEAILGAKT